MTSFFYSSLIVVSGIVIIWIFLLIICRAFNGSAKKPPKMTSEGSYILKPSKLLGISAIALFITLIIEMIAVLIWFNQYFSLLWIICSLFLLGMAVYCSFVAISYCVIVKDNQITQIGITGKSTIININEITKINCDMFNMRQIIYSKDKKIHLHYQVYGYYFLWNLIGTYYFKDDYKKSNRQMEIIATICNYL